MFDSWAQSARETYIHLFGPTPMLIISTACSANILSSAYTNFQSEPWFI